MSESSLKRFGVDEQWAQTLSCDDCNISSQTQGGAMEIPSAWITWEWNVEMLTTNLVKVFAGWLSSQLEDGVVQNDNLSQCILCIYGTQHYR